MTDGKDPYTQIRIPSIDEEGGRLRGREALGARAITRMMLGRSADAAGVGFQERSGGMLSMVIVGRDGVAR